MHVTPLPGVTCAPEVRESISESLPEKVVCMDRCNGGKKKEKETYQRLARPKKCHENAT